MTSWNEIVAGLPGAHVLQSFEWGQVKTQNSWQPQYYVWTQDAAKGPEKVQVHRIPQAETGEIDIPEDKVRAAAQLLIRRANPLPVSIAYCPKGPLMEWSDASLRAVVLTDLETIAKREGAFLLKIDPDVRAGTGVPGSPQDLINQDGIEVVQDLKNTGWRYSENQIQFPNSVELDLTPTEEELLAGFKQKTRYNIRLAGRRGVTVRLGTADDFGQLYQLYAETAIRDGFTIRGESYYRQAWGDFIINPLLDQADPVVPQAMPILAEADGEVIAGVILYQFAGSAWFIFGMSSSGHRKKMPNYLLQWEAITRLKQSGNKRYDLWGAPDVFSEADPLWGVYRFKEGFRGTVIRHIGAWDRPVNSFWFGLYANVMPQILKLMRARGNHSTQESVREYPES